MRAWKPHSPINIYNVPFKMPYLKTNDSFQRSTTIFESVNEVYHITINP